MQTLQRWVFAIPCVLLLIAHLSASGSDRLSCPQPCSCNRGGTIKCTCNSFAEDIVLTRKLLHHFDIRAIRVENCCKVIFPSEERHELDKLPVENIRLANLQHLRIDNSGLSFLDRAKTIVIENVKRFDIDRFWFHGANSLDLLELRSVNIGTIANNAMSFYFKIDNFHIYNCRINVIMADGLVSRSAAHFRIINSTVDVIDDGGIKVMKADQVSLVSNRIGALRTWSIDLEEVDELEVRHCTFDRIYSHAFRANSSVSRLKFENNTIWVMRKESLATLRVTKRVTIAGNRIYGAYEDSLIPNRHFKATDVKLVMSNNSFSCDCHMEWMLNDWLYQPLIVNSTCFQPEEHAEKRLPQIRKYVQYAGRLPCPPPNGDRILAFSLGNVFICLFAILALNLQTSWVS